MGITYYEDCLLGQKSAIEKWLCGNSWQQTQFNKAAVIVLGVVIILGILFLVFRTLKRK